MPNPTGRNDESIEPKLKQKKPYMPPTLTVLTPGQAILQLIQRALLGEAEAQQLLATASQFQGSNERGSIPRKPKAVPRT